MIHDTCDLCFRLDLRCDRELRLGFHLDGVYLVSNDTSPCCGMDATQVGDISQENRKRAMNTSSSNDSLIEFKTVVYLSRSLKPGSFLRMKSEFC